MAYSTNTFCWHGILSTDVDKAKSFYSKALDWEISTQPMGDGEATMLGAGGRAPHAHLGQATDDIPSHWSNFLKVDDVDATVAAAVEHGGAVQVPPMDIPVGRMAVITAPSGAAVALFKEADTSASDPEDGVGSIHWTELQTHSLDADVAWLKGVFGYSVNKMPLPNDQTYFLLMAGERACGGVMQAPVAEAPSMWVTWVRVADLDATSGKVEAAGGRLLTEPMVMDGVGRMRVAMDNTGGVFGIITPAAS